MEENNTKLYGLIGKNIDYSFSKKYFTEKFSEPIFENCLYENFDIQSVEEFQEIIKNNPNLNGLNVTIPYKETIIPFLDTLSKKRHYYWCRKCYSDNQKKQTKRL